MRRCCRAVGASLAPADALQRGCRAAVDLSGRRSLEDQSGRCADRLLDGREYEELAVDTQIGDTILFFSDGIEDQLNAKEEEYSRGRVHRLLKKHGARDAQIDCRCDLHRSGRVP